MGANQKPGRGHFSRLVSLCLQVVCGVGLSRPASEAAPNQVLPQRIRRIVLHVPGGPSYHQPERRFVFYSPPETMAFWKPSFGAHWIVWTDGSVWPRRPLPGERASFMPPAGPADSVWRQRIALQAAPVYSQLYRGNSRSVGVEVAHSGRSDEPFPDVQVRSLAWLLRTLIDISGGRLREASVVGHKDVDRRPAYRYRRCEKPGCPVYVDAAGRPLRRRVDPPESLFRSLASAGLVIPRPPGSGDEDLRRAEALPTTARAPVAGSAR